MSRRYERLYVEYERLKFLFANHPRIHIVEAAGDPPDHYVVEYFVRGLVETKGSVEIRGEHRVQITLGPNYPNESPYCAMLTPVFHPNIDGFKICTEDVTPAGRRLDQIVVFIGRLIAFQAYNLSSPRNGAARAWAEQNLARFPLETTELLPQVIQDGSPLPSFRESDIPVPPPHTLPPEPLPHVVHDRSALPSFRESDIPVPPPRAASAPCRNCANEIGVAQLRQCEMGHSVCPDCSLPCSRCGRELCALCAPASCQQCSRPLCASCEMRCACGTVLCAGHARTCPICRSSLCWGCLAMCGGCGLLCCRTHLDTSGRCPACERGRPASAADDRFSTGEARHAGRGVAP